VTRYVASEGVAFAPWTFDLKLRDGAVTGAVYQHRSDASGMSTGAVGPFEIFEGRLDGSRLTFKAGSPGGERVATFNGELAGNEIRFTRTLELKPGTNPGQNGILGARGATEFVASKMAPWGWASVVRQISEEAMCGGWMSKKIRGTANAGILSRRADRCGALSCEKTNAASRRGNVPRWLINSTVTHKEIAAGYLLAGVILCLGFYFGAKIEGDAGSMFLRGFYLFAALIVLKYTFAWGRNRGFPVRRDDGSIAISHIVRSLVMAAIVWLLLSFLFAPLTMVAFKLGRWHAGRSAGEEAAESLDFRIA
jgi:hypothetical protein